jgi:hypothetical protein
MVIPTDNKKSKIKSVLMSECYNQAANRKEPGRIYRLVRSLVTKRPQNNKIIEEEHKEHTTEDRSVSSLLVTVNVVTLDALDCVTSLKLID